MDGTAPTKASAKYSEPIPVKEDMTIKAFAAKDGMTDSAVSEAKYTIGKEPVITKYLVTINNGTGDGEYEENATVTIKADEPAEGKAFDKESVGTVLFLSDLIYNILDFIIATHPLFEEVDIRRTYYDQDGEIIQKRFPVVCFSSVSDLRRSAA